MGVAGNGLPRRKGKGLVLSRVNQRQISGWPKFIIPGTNLFSSVRRDDTKVAQRSTTGFCRKQSPRPGGMLEVLLLGASSGEVTVLRRPFKGGTGRLLLRFTAEKVYNTAT